MFYPIVKRFIDITVSLVALILFSPLLAISAVLIKLFVGPPILFKQARPGLNGELFVLIKFRTMSNEKDQNGDLLPDEHRLGKLGKFLRSASIDELPSLYNVLIGELSLVGPRPLLPSYLELYSEQQARRHEVTPGITGWAQIKGRNTLTWEKKFQLDVWYVDNKSIYLDFKILFLTVYKVFKREGVSSDSHVTMYKFTGNDKN